MSDFPTLATQVPSSTIHSLGPESLFDAFLARQSATTSSAWTTANRAIYLPFYLESTVTAYQIAVHNGATLGGNLDVGIYDINGVRLVSKGSTAQAGVSVIQKLDIADTVLTPGTYFMAMSTDSTTATYLSTNASNGVGEFFRACGIQEQLTAFALPANATFANPATTTTTLPTMCIATHAVI